jgi:hypothetical protein
MFLTFAVILVFAAVEGALTWHAFERAALFRRIESSERIMAENAARSLNLERQRSRDTAPASDVQLTKTRTAPLLAE